jgi:hypothetical protein
MESEIAEPEPELYFILVRAPDDPALSSDDYQKVLREFHRSLWSAGIEHSARSYTRDSIGGGGGLVGTFGVVASALGPALCTALGAYLNARCGRKVRLTIELDGKIEAEAQTVDQIRELVKVAEEYKKKTTPG